MTGCAVCPRQCGADRENGEMGFCQSDGTLRVARAALHFWEEPPISGEKGSGAVFFTGCSLRCRYCQNWEISVGENRGKPVTPEELSRLFFSLIEQGAHNINLVTPTHFVPLLRQALLLKKLPVPVVYNTSGYERVETLKALEGMVDIYLPDFKYAQPQLAAALSRAPDYPRTALSAIGEMVRQVGPPVYDEGGLMKRGVLIRHLVLPGHTKNSMEALELISREFPGIPVSLMAQYTPWGEAAKEGGIPGYPELSRRVTKREFEKVRQALFALELDGFVQERSAAKSAFIPDFHQFDGSVKSCSRKGKEL